MPGVRLGIDLGGTLVKMALVDEKGVVLAVNQVSTRGGPRSLAKTLRLAADAWKGRRILGTGVGVAGDVDPVKGVVRFAPNLKWKNVPLKKYFSEAGFPAPLHFENDATAAAWGAYHAALKRRSRNLVVLTLGTGVGGGLVIDGNLYRGATGTAGELGHMTLDPAGRLCGCGNRGCLETYIGGRHIVERAREIYSSAGRKFSGEMTPKSLYDAARRGDAEAKGVWKAAAEGLGAGLANLINIFNPDTILLTGGVAGAAPLFMPIAKNIAAKRAFKTPFGAARIVVSSARRDLGVIGAALLGAGR